MVTQDTKNLAVCASNASELESLVEAIRLAGAWGILPIQWPNEPALLAARHTAHAYVLHCGVEPCDELQTRLGSRPDHAPLIVVGTQPAPRAAPTLWFAEVPKPSLLAALITNLLDGQIESGGVPAPAWRRKSDMIIGSSSPIRQLLQSLDQLAPAQTPVLITGESGVGKELVARALHYCGPRATEPFIAINCAAIPENLFEAELFGYQRGAFTGAVNAHAGAFEAAHKGTLFLDEIGEMPQSMQAKLLRVLETSEVTRIGSTDSKKVNFRLVTATNRKLEKEVAQGRFREDLYYRVQVYPLHVAPLRERPEDIPQLVTHHLSAIGMRENRPSLRVTSAALEKLISYRWPGNVRELVNLLERATLLSDNRVIDAEHVIFPSSTGLSSEP
ncbi:MAG: Response regulator of zinc sigma-54-dependent two-component system, partial [bacterium]|nr:Response regulator of zinc sigma-54-dependent two-component system [bacterium]